ncbi:MAG: translation initiation factor IF-2 [bacterium]|nr:translation initiation factor IF-2 [bacterium]
MNVAELARKMNATREELLATLATQGIDIGSHAIKVQPQVAQKVLRLWESGKLVIKRATEEEKAERRAVPHSKVTGPIAVGPRIRVSELAEKFQVPAASLIAELMKNGVMATLNQDIDFETAELLGSFLGVKVERLAEAEEEYHGLSIEELRAEDTAEQLLPRPPVIVIMGHVDHGKTTLLDTIRKAHVADKETGGITQHIGAYQIEKDGKKLTFLDTPGHEAFRAMRTRGGKVADIAILVVAANDGVQPQTREAVQIILQEKLPLIVAVNKIDAPGAEPDRIKRELAELNLLPEDWGGKIPCVNVSAKKGENIDTLLATVMLTSDLLDLRANPNRPAIGTIIESHRDSGEGSVATVIIQAGTLKRGENIVVGDAWGTIKALKDEHGAAFDSVGPGSPAQILGLKAEPTVGDILQVIVDKKEWREKLKEREGKVAKRARTDTALLRVEVESGKQTYNIILKSDVLGSEEAIIESLLKIQHPDVGVNIISRGLGNVTDSDILQAEAAGASIIAFRVKLTPQAAELASEKNVTVNQFEIIYGLIDHVKEGLRGMLKPEIIRTDLGMLKVQAIFRKENKYTIAGGMVHEGKLAKGIRVEIWRGEELVGTGTIGGLQSAKQEVEEVRSGSECGIRIETKADIAVDDRIVAYTQEEKERTL